MAINRNITELVKGAGRAAGEDEGLDPLLKLKRGGSLKDQLTGAPPFKTDPEKPPAQKPPPGEPSPEKGGGADLPFDRDLLDKIRDLGGVVPPFRDVFQVPLDKTTTQIAQGAVKQLRGAGAAVIREAVSTIKNKNITAAGLLNFLERRTRVGEVLNELANDWSAPTKQDFAEAFQMPNTADKLPVMDAMVSISILNDPDLKNELQAENTTSASQADLLENRRIVWQWPQPGTPFTPPYLIMVAVERQDTTQAQNIIQSIMGDLVDFQGFKIPSAAVPR